MQREREKCNMHYEVQSTKCESRLIKYINFTSFSYCFRKV